MTDAPVLEVEGLSIDFDQGGRSLRAIEGLTYSLRRGETLAVVGESGSGKTVSAHAIMGRLPDGGRISAGQVRFRGQDLLSLDRASRRALRGEGIAMILQDSAAALNPLEQIGWQIGEGLRVRRGWSRQAAQDRAVELLDRVGIPAAANRSSSYPHELSGGMRQRVAIAMALALEPDVLIADEPTTALDVTIQAQVLDLFKDLQREFGMALILITHDLGVVSVAADSVVVMYAGRMMESGDAQRVLQCPSHPYTVALLRSNPDLVEAGGRIHPIAGAPPRLDVLPSGCVFHPRCERAVDICRTVTPPAVSVEPRRLSTCHFADEVIGS